MTDENALSLELDRGRKLGRLAVGLITVGLVVAGVSTVRQRLQPTQRVVAGATAPVPPVILSGTAQAPAPSLPASSSSVAAAGTTAGGDGGTPVAVGSTSTTTLEAVTPAASTSAPKPVVSLAPVTTTSLPPFTVPTVPPLNVGTAPRASDKPIVVAVASGVTDMNPHLASSLRNDNAAVMGLVLPSPFRSGIRGEAVLDQEVLAEAPKVLNKDPLLVQYVVHPDAAWSDGTPIGCNDFRLAALAASARYLQRQANGVTVSAFRTATVPAYQGASIACDDPKHITVSLTSAEPDWQWLFGSLLPAHIVMNAANVTDLNAVDDPSALRLATAWNSMFSLAKDLPASAVSGGPFKVAKVSIDGVLLTANDKFWGQPPATKAGILVKAVPDGQAFDGIRSGTGQVAELVSDGARLAAVAAGSGAKVVRSAPVALTEVVMNFGKPELQQRALREAIAACIDRPSLIAARVVPVLPDATAADNRLFAPDQPGYRRTDGNRASGVDAARAALVKLGYSFSTKTGVAEKAGRPLSLRLSYHPANTLEQAVADGIVAQCAPAGIDVTASADADTVSEDGAWDLAILTGPGERSLGARTGRYTIGHPADVGRYSSTQLATLLRQASSAISDADNADALNRADEALWADVATVPLYRAPALAIHNANVTGVAVAPGSVGVFGSARFWR